MFEKVLRNIFAPGSKEQVAPDFRKPIITAFKVCNLQQLFFWIIKKNVMGGACSMYDRDEKPGQGIGEES